MIEIKQFVATQMFGWPFNDFNQQGRDIILAVLKATLTSRQRQLIAHLVEQLPWRALPRNLMQHPSLDERTLRLNISTEFSDVLEDLFSIGGPKRNPPEDSTTTHICELSLTVPDREYHSAQDVADEIVKLETRRRNVQLEILRMQDAAIVHPVSLS